MKKTIANYISIIGHPMITFSVFVILAMFRFEEVQNAFLISFLIVGGVILPSAIRNHIKTKKGEYTNFDVSVRTQRYSMYLFAIALLSLLTILLFYTKQSINLCLGVLFGLILIIISFMVNFFIKCSGHVSLTIFLAFLILPLNPVIGVLVLLYSALIGWSRIELQRHTKREVFAGTVIGFSVGLLMLLAEEYLI